jgi:hypothetical protein
MACIFADLGGKGHDFLAGGAGVALQAGGAAMLYVVLFTDNAEHADSRRRLMPEHLAFLERHGDSIRAAGPLRDAVDGAAAGGMWLVQAMDAEAVMSLVHEDPFWPTGLRRSVRILEWTQVFADGRRLA